MVLDTSYLLAWHRQNDRLHARAERIRRVLSETGPIRIVLDCVYSEMIAVLARIMVKREGRVSDFLAKEIELRRVYWPRLVWMTYVGGRDLFERAVKVSREGAEDHGVGISPHDAMLLIFCLDHQVPYLVSFDRDLALIESIEGIPLELSVIDDSNAEELLP